jgi:hypothetical protein
MRRTPVHSRTAVSTDVKHLLPLSLLRSGPLGPRLGGYDPLSLKEEDVHA